eukprot:1178985-Pyramimonas_sp.AAC.1
MSTRIVSSNVVRLPGESMQYTRKAGNLTSDAPALDDARSNEKQGYVLPELRGVRCEAPPQASRMMRAPTRLIFPTN